MSRGNSRELAAYLAHAIFAVDKTLPESTDRLVYMHKDPVPGGKERAGGGLCEGALADHIQIALETYDGNPWAMRNLEPQPLRQSYVLVTQGQDPEIDAIGVITQVLRGLPDKDATDRILEYVNQRCAT